LIAADSLTLNDTFDSGCKRSYLFCVSRPDGRFGEHRKVAGEESPGSMDVRCRITSGGREPRESATENKPPRRVAFGRGKGETVR
jgi:hypothetical protein